MNLIALALTSIILTYTYLAEAQDCSRCQGAQNSANVYCTLKKSDGPISNPDHPEDDKDAPALVDRYAAANAGIDKAALVESMPDRHRALGQANFDKSDVLAKAALLCNRRLGDAKEACVQQCKCKTCNSLNGTPGVLKSQADEDAKTGGEFMKISNSSK